MKKLSSKIILLLFIVVFCLYIYESIRFHKVYEEYALKQTIDISEANKEYNFEYSHLFHSDYYEPRLCLSVPAKLLEGGKSWNEVTQNVSFKLGVILKNGSREPVNDTFSVENGSYICSMLRRYSYQPGDSKFFKLSIKVLEPEKDNNFSKVLVTVRGFSKGGGIYKSLYLLLSIILGGLFLTVALRGLERRRI